MFTPWKECYDQPRQHFKEALLYQRRSILSRLWLFQWSCMDVCTEACQAPQSMRFSRKEYWSELPFPPPRDLPNHGTEPTTSASFALLGKFFTTEPPGKPYLVHTRFLIKLKCLEDRFRSWFYLHLQVGQVAHTVQGNGTWWGKTYDKCNHIFLCPLPSSLTTYMIRFLCTKEDKSAGGKMTIIKC